MLTETTMDTAALLNSPVVDSSEVWGGFRVARRARPVDLQVMDDGGVLSVICGHDGFKRLPGKPIHYRQWELGADSLKIIDRIEGAFKDARGRFYFHPEVRVSMEGLAAGKAILADGNELKWQVDGGSCRLEDTSWHPEFGKSLGNKCLVVDFVRPECNVIFSW